MEGRLKNTKRKKRQKMSRLLGKKNPHGAGEEKRTVPRVREGEGSSIKEGPTQCLRTTDKERIERLVRSWGGPHGPCKLG